MGYDYYIACKSCLTFVDLGRWRIFHDLQFPHGSKELFPGAGNVAAASIDGARLRERLRMLDDPFSLQSKGEADFQKLVTILVKFCDDHDGHELYFLNDSGDFPWDACAGYPWYEWKEVIGPNTNLGKIDLPKNLIQDLHLNSWDEVRMHLEKLHSYSPGVFPGGVEIAKDGFEKIRKN